MRSLLAFALLVSLAPLAQAAAPPKITLEQAIKRALTQNPEVLDQIEELARSQAQLVEVRAASLPTLSASGTYTRAPVTPAAEQAMLAFPDNVSALLTASLPLLAPRSWVAWSHQKRSTEVAELGVASVKRQVALTVAGAFLQILTSRREVELEVRARDTAKAHADYTHTRLVGGVGSRLDDVRARQELESDEQLVVTANLALERAQETLGLLIAADGPVDAGDEPWFATVDPTEAVKEAPERRADLRALDSQRLLTQRIVHDAWADYMPSVSASFSGPIYSWPSTVFQPSLSWQFQLVLTLPLYDGGLRYGLERERRTDERRAQIDQQNALRQMRSDVRFGDSAVKKTEEAMARAHAAAQLAHQAVQIADLAYHAGATTNLELIDAERRARDADTAAALAEDSVRQARMRSLFAAGRLP